MRGMDHFFIPPVGGHGPDIPPPPPPAAAYAAYATPSMPGGIPLPHSTTPYAQAPPLPYYTAPPPASYTPYSAQMPLYTSSTPYRGHKATAHYSRPPSPYHGYGYSSSYVQPPSPRQGYGQGLPHVFDYNPSAYAAHEHGNSPFIPPYQLPPDDRDDVEVWHRLRKSPKTPLMRPPTEPPAWDAYGDPWGMSGLPAPHAYGQAPPYAANQIPQLSTLIAAVADSVRVVYDLRYDCQTAIFKIAGSSTSPVSLVQCFTTIATNPAVRSLRIVCPEFPWVITVTSSNYAGVTVGDILQTTYKELQKPVTNAEWWIASESVRERVLKFWHESLEDQLEEADTRDGKAKKKHKRMLADVETRRKAGIKRIDWVREQTMWGGLVGSHPVIDERSSNWGDKKEVTYALLLK